MKEAFEKIKETFANIRRVVETDEDLEWNRAVYKCKTIVSEVEAEYNKKFEPSLDLIEYGVDGYNLHLKEQYRKGYEDAKAEYGNGWIPCNRADHPYDGQRVLACINTRIATHEIIITDYNGEIYWFDGTISAWMPLPSPYKPTTD